MGCTNKFIFKILISEYVCRAFLEYCCLCVVFGLYNMVNLYNRCLSRSFFKFDHKPCVLYFLDNTLVFSWCVSIMMCMSVVNATGISCAMLTVYLSIYFHQVNIYL